MYRKLFNFAVTTLTLLTANLLTTFITDKLISYKWEAKPLRFTLISMAIITLVFYPLFIKLQDWLNRFSRRFIKAGHGLAGKYLGLLLMFAAGMLVLTYFYAKMWYNINIFNLMVNGQLPVLIIAAVVAIPVPELVSVLIPIFIHNHISTATAAGMINGGISPGTVGDFNLAGCYYPTPLIFCTTHQHKWFGNFTIVSFTPHIDSVGRSGNEYGVVQWIEMAEPGAYMTGSSGHPGIRCKGNLAILKFNAYLEAILIIQAHIGYGAGTFNFGTVEIKIVESHDLLSFRNEPAVRKCNQNLPGTVMVSPLKTIEQPSPKSMVTSLGKVVMSGWLTLTV
jgi:hypothetical protein